MSDQYQYPDSEGLYQRVKQLENEATFGGEEYLKIAEDALGNDVERIKGYYHWLDHGAGRDRPPRPPLTPPTVLTQEKIWVVLAKLDSSNRVTYGKATWALDCDSNTRYRLLLDQRFLARRADGPHRHSDAIKELASDAVLGILSPFGDGEDFIFTQLGEPLYYDGDDWDQVTENNADHYVWEKTGFAVVIKFEKGESGGVWLVFNFWPEHNDLHRYEHENLAKGVGGEFNGVYGSFAMAKIADHISELGPDAVFRVRETSTSMNIAEPRETFRVSEGSPLVCRTGI